MKRATFIRKRYVTEYSRTYTELDYQYRGREYTVVDYGIYAGEPLSWQHRNAQNRIDHEIETEEKFEKMSKKPIRYEDTAKYGLDMFFQLINEEGQA